MHVVPKGDFRLSGTENFPGTMRCALWFDCASQRQEAAGCVPTWLAACLRRGDVRSPTYFIVDELIVAFCFSFGWTTDVNFLQL